MAAVLHRLVNGEPYTFTWVPAAAGQSNGWKVTAATALTDRFARSYFVRCDAKGRPLRCTCASCARGGQWCKHLKEAELIYREQHAAEYAVELRETMARCGL